jgi:hypothetical protein
MRNPRRELQNITLPLEAKAYAHLNDCNRVALLFECGGCIVGVVFKVYLPVDPTEEPTAVKEAYFILCRERGPLNNIALDNVLYAASSNGRYLAVIDDHKLIAESILSQCNKTERFVCINGYSELVELI